MAFELYTRLEDGHGGTMLVDGGDDAQRDDHGKTVTIHLDDGQPGGRPYRVRMTNEAALLLATQIVGRVAADIHSHVVTEATEAT